MKTTPVLSQFDGVFTTFSVCPTDCTDFTPMDMKTYVWEASLDEVQLTQTMTITWNYKCKLEED